jgi:hypothetical protein
MDKASDDARNQGSVAMLAKNRREACQSLARKFDGDRSITLHVCVCLQTSPAPPEVLGEVVACSTCWRVQYISFPDLVADINSDEKVAATLPLRKPWLM